MNATELRAWRKALRDDLLTKRLAVPHDTLSAWRVRIDTTLDAAFPNLARGVVGLCWPFQNEYDARHLARHLRERGGVTALPVVVAPRAPLEFREWHPGVVMQNGVYDIPYPTGTRVVTPTTLLIPMNGFDRAGYRLGYGGGFFDRTLAALAERGAKPGTIGVTFELAAIETIQPQPHDIPMDFVVTERGVYRRDASGLVFLGLPPATASTVSLSSPVCYADELDPGYFGDTAQPRNNR